MKHELRINGDEREGLITIENYTRGKAIRLMCTECMGYEENPIDCTSNHCPLFPYRKRTYMAFKSETT